MCFKDSGCYIRLSELSLDELVLGFFKYHIPLGPLSIICSVSIFHQMYISKMAVKWPKYVQASQKLFCR